MSYGPQNGRLWYPRNDNEPDTITVSLHDVRAADDLVIGYDFDRDGWTISHSANPARELAFVPSWEENEAPDSNGMTDDQPRL